jgi:hypothetical protein
MRSYVGPAPSVTLVIASLIASPLPAPAERASPDEIENAISEFLANQPGLEVTSIRSIQCDEHRCEIALTGRDPNPTFVDQYSALWHKILTHHWDHFRPLQGGLGTREIAPGAKEYVAGFRYIAFEPPSDNPVIAARQQAVCAAVWRGMAADAEAQARRVTEQDASAEARTFAAGRITTASNMRQEARLRIELAAATLGWEEAELVAATTTTDVARVEACHRPGSLRALVNPP